MDPFAVTTGALQVIQVCAQCTVSLVRYIDSVKNVDERIRELVAEINALSQTNSALKRVLEDRTMLAAAKAADESAGGLLWTQIRVSLRDCNAAMESLAKILHSIDQSKTSLFSRPMKQFKETIKSADIQRYRNRIRIFNSTISMPVQMMTVYLQVEQRELSTQQQINLEKRMQKLSATIDGLIGQMVLQSGEGSVVALTTTSSDETVVNQHINDCAKTARRFLSTASEKASSQKSYTAGSTVIAPQDVRRSIGAASEFGEVMSPEKRSRIDSWVRPNDDDNLDGSQYRVSQATSDYTAESARTSGLMEMQIPERKSDSTDFSLRLTFKYLANGQKHAENGDYAGAEKHFRKALGEMGKNNFQDRIALRPCEVKVMLAEACLGQSKYQDAENLLLPLSRREDDTDHLTSLAAHHALAETYLKKGALEQAEPCAKQAVEGRDAALGATHPSYIKSLKLMLELCKAKGDDADFEAYQEMLPVESPIEHPPTPLFNLDDLDPLPEEPDTVRLMEKPPSVIEKRSRFFGMRKSSKDQKKVSVDDLLKSPDLTSASTASSMRSVRMPSPALSPIRISQSASENADLDSQALFLSPVTTRNNTMKSPSISSASPPAPLTHYPSSQKTTREIAISKGFAAVKAHCIAGKHKKAVQEAISFLKAAYAYTDKSKLLFEPELTANVQNSGPLGLAGTGRGYAPLHFFASAPTEELLEINLLINDGVDVNATDSIGKADRRSHADTALLYAVERGHINIVRRLLDCPGIKIDTIGSLGLTPLWLAVDCGQHLLVELLLEKGARIDKVDSSGQIVTTLLHRAAQKHDTATLRMLLQKNHPADTLDNERRTPLMMAFAAASIAGKSKPWPAAGAEAVNLLLDHGANINLKDSRGNDAMTRALKGPWEAVEFLNMRQLEQQQHQHQTQQLLSTAPAAPVELLAGLEEVSMTGSDRERNAKLVLI